MFCDRVRHRGWNGVSDLQRLLSAWSAEHVIQWESLDYSGLTDGDCSIECWVNRERTMTCNQRAGFICLETSVGDRPLALFDSGNLADNARRVRHRSNVVESNAVSVAHGFSDRTGPDRRQFVEQLVESGRRRQRLGKRTALSTMRSSGRCDWRAITTCPEEEVSLAVLGHAERAGA